MARAFRSGMTTALSPSEKKRSGNFDDRSLARILSCRSQLQCSTKIDGRISCEPKCRSIVTTRPRQGGPFPGPISRACTQASPGRAAGNKRHPTFSADDTTPIPCPNSEISSTSAARPGGNVPSANLAMANPSFRSTANDSCFLGDDVRDCEDRCEVSASLLAMESTLPAESV